jgi:hypothetical protein
VVQFDVSAIPPGMLISSATLKIHMESICYPTANSGDVFTTTTYRIDSPWAENTITWNNKPSHAEAYGKLGLPLWPDTIGWHQFNVTALVQGWINGSFPNYGIAVRGQETGGQNFVFTTFNTREGKADKAPVLLITYPTSAASVPLSRLGEEPTPVCRLSAGGATVCSTGSPP